MRRFPLPFLVVALVAIALSELHATGALYVRPLNSSQTHQVMNIKTYDATVEINEQIAETFVDQVFVNNLNTRVEATFIFPLPESAVITHLAYWFNGRRYVGSIREKQQAQQAYNNKIRRLLDPALLQAIGDNIFKLNIAPIEARSEVRFEIRYAELLNYDAGAVSYRFPLNTTSLSPTPLERVSVQIRARTNSVFKSFSSPSHGNSLDLSIRRESESDYSATFGDENFLPDRDLRLRFELQRDEVDVRVASYAPAPADSFGVDKFYALWITPPEDLSRTEDAKRDVVFTADVSSSMEGYRLEQLKVGMHTFLDALNDNDRFNIVVFSTDVKRFQPDLVPATTAMIAEAEEFVDKLGAVGLTNIDAALRSSLSMSFREESANMLMFLTDGQPTWGELDQHKIVEQSSAANSAGIRVYPLGLGDDVSHSLLHSLAEKNGGFASFIDQSDSIAVVVANHFKRVSLPVLSALNLDMGGLQLYDVYPNHIPDLFWGTQMLQFGRYREGGEFPISLSGRIISEDFNLRQSAFFGEEEGGQKAVARLWAVSKVSFLLREIERLGEQKELVDAVIDLSIRFQILTKYTALYADPDDPDSDDTPTDVKEQPGQIVSSGGWRLEQNYPNPIRTNTRIRFEVPESDLAQRVTLKVYDLQGRLLAVLFDGIAVAGKHEIEWDGADLERRALPSGLYTYRLQAGGIVLSRLLVIQR